MPSLRRPPRRKHRVHGAGGVPEAPRGRLPRGRLGDGRHRDPRPLLQAALRRRHQGRNHRQHPRPENLRPRLGQVLPRGEGPLRNEDARLGPQRPLHRTGRLRKPPLVLPGHRKRGLRADDDKVPLRTRLAQRTLRVCIALVVRRTTVSRCFAWSLVVVFDGFEPKPKPNGTNDDCEDTSIPPTPKKTTTTTTTRLLCPLLLLLLLRKLYPTKSHIIPLTLALHSSRPPLTFIPPSSCCSSGTNVSKNIYLSIYLSPGLSCAGTG
mmetsp:Transcript_1089/g.3708  ORF Transcript_1089/g.3708 Transcript_1089/m.3708 type:complete len:265 (-) Transcript_1089:190-984(-)